MKRLSYFLHQNLEVVFWIVGLLILYCMPVRGEHFSLCPLKAIGFKWCPGCGLGHSIHYYLHFDFQEGWHAHYLGAFAIVIILYRIFQLIIRTSFQQKFQNQTKTM